MLEDPPDEEDILDLLNANNELAGRFSSVRIPDNTLPMILKTASQTIIIPAVDEENDNTPPTNLKTAGQTMKIPAVDEEEDNIPPSDLKTASQTIIIPAVADEKDNTPPTDLKTASQTIIIPAVDEETDNTPPTDLTTASQTIIIPAVAEENVTTVPIPTIGPVPGLEVTVQGPSLQDKDVFPMEKTFTHRVLHGHTEYLVKWLGYPASQNTWESQANILNRAFINAYENHKKPRRTRAVNSIHMVKYPDAAPLPNPPPTAVRNATAQNTANHAWLLCHKLLLILLIFSFFTPLQCLNLGPLYECTKLSPQGIFKLPAVSSCDHDIHTTKTPMTSFTADIYAYRSVTTRFTIYHCMAEYVRHHIL